MPKNTYRDEIRADVENYFLENGGNYIVAAKVLGLTEYHTRAIRNDMLKEGKLPAMGRGTVCPPLVNPQTHISWLEKQLHDARQELQRIRSTPQPQWSRNRAPEWERRSDVVANR